ncbi:unnamed protein product [Acanthoscelides obtectus]|uniref:BESS domain-containing protein n=1 Tax=Acanthoscelides obtectus TaxID=200917 RepID=A0A9P0PTU1_ACAOB|nr:unnamed protein product [Acanthoscelides obtectus]CAK1654638.1 hypothetical protein AOBTE_LOCUS18734 [Acanthoscelides obtectus]
MSKGVHKPPHHHGFSCENCTTGNFDSDTSEEEGHNESDIATTSALSLSESHSPISSPHPENSSTPKPSRPAKMTPFQESLIKNLSQASSSITQARVDEDADRLYLLSLLPDYKALSPGQKWAFREHVGYFFRQTFVPPDLRLLCHSKTTEPLQHIVLNTPIKNIVHYLSLIT